MKDAEIKFEGDTDDPKKVKVLISGKLTIDNTPDFREALMLKLEKYNDFTIEITNADSIDLSFYQLLISVRNTLQKQNKKVNITMKLPAEEEELLKQAGFNTQLS